MKKSDVNLSPQRLRELVGYSEETGVFVWKVGRGGAKVGAVAGAPTPYGYITFKVDGVNYQAHRLAWLYVHGKWPGPHVDHRNGVRSDNRIDNLRDVSRTVNNQNQRAPHKNNRAGFLGVATTKWGRYQATISAFGKKHNLGNFASAEEASAAYAAAKQQLHIQETA